MNENENLNTIQNENLAEENVSPAMRAMLDKYQQALKENEILNQKNQELQGENKTWAEMIVGQGAVSTASESERTVTPDMVEKERRELANSDLTNYQVIGKLFEFVEDYQALYPDRDPFTYAQRKELDPIKEESLKQQMNNLIKIYKASSNEFEFNSRLKDALTGRGTFIPED